ncbi:hypothetical protein HQ529_01815, partial [Candidatus Woesearchaeota archaeon]|nr:hypothetical protein [Candidatus Woesearchaeota archaeon]
IFGSDAKEVDEKLLADRTFIACDTGLISQELEVKIAELERSGVRRKDSAAYYAGTLRAIAGKLESGMTGNEMYNQVAGPRSFTEGLKNDLADNGYFDLLKQLIQKTVKGCK